MKREATVIEFPDKPRPVTTVDSRFGRWRLRIQDAVRLTIARTIGGVVPGAIRDFEHYDEVTGQQISVRVGLLYTRIRVDGRDYYFDRVSGRFDGTGTSNP